MSDPDDLGSKTFSMGKRSGKTYLEVFQTDERMCKMALSGARTPFLPEDFKEFVIQNLIPKIKVRKGIDFVDAFTPGLKMKFKSLVGDIRPEKRILHPECSGVVTSTILGTFYQVFINKCISNVANIDAYCQYVEQYAAIFPFPVSEKINQCNTEILDMFDEEMLNEMQSFLNDHFDNMKLQSISNIFFANISNFKKKNFFENTLSKISRNNKGLPKLERTDYLKNFPRVNSLGATRYKIIYDIFNNIMDLYQKPHFISANKYTIPHLMKLPEINLSELFSLLDPEFLRAKRSQYIYLFQKYLFFFSNALKSETKPVFFIDEVLFECLKSLNTFRKSRDDVLNLKYDLSLISLIFRRKHLCDDGGIDLHVDDENLRHVKDYVEKFPKISTARVDFEVITDILESKILVSTDDTAMESCFRKKSRDKNKIFYQLILHGALSSKKIKRLVYYNAFNGEESSISMPQNKQAIIDFIRLYNKCNFSEKLPPEKFITQKQEHLYKGEVAQWESTRNVIL